jgi:hypothetical protein
VAGSFPCGQTLRQSGQHNAAQSPQNVGVACAQSRNGQQLVVPAEWEEDFEEGLVKINMSNLEVKLI